MATYSVTLPIAGYAIVDVEADSEEAAIDAALGSELTLKDIEVWEALRAIVTGNILHTSPNNASAELLDDDD